MMENSSETAATGIVELISSAISDLQPDYMLTITLILIAITAVITSGNRLLFKKKISLEILLKRCLGAAAISNAFILSVCAFDPTLIQKFKLLIVPNLLLAAIAVFYLGIAGLFGKVGSDDPSSSE